MLFKAKIKVFMDHKYEVNIFNQICLSDENMNIYRSTSVQKGVQEGHLLLTHSRSLVYILFLIVIIF